jgi:hypothetical protein
MTSEYVENFGDLFADKVKSLELPKLVDEASVDGLSADLSAFNPDEPPLPPQNKQCALR